METVDHFLTVESMPTPPAHFLITKEHRRFVEFADACRRERYIGVCTGPPGVGKTLSAREYSHWDEIRPWLTDSWNTADFYNEDTIVPRGPDSLDTSRSLFWTPTVTSTPGEIKKQIPALCERFSAVIEYHLEPEGRHRPHRHFAPEDGHVELLIVDEADRLRTTGLEQLRDFFDRHNIGLILIGMPGLTRRLARYPQLYSRVGFAHQYAPLSSQELRFVLTHHWQKLGLALNAEDFTDTEAVATVAQITNGNFRLVHRLFAQIVRILEINQLKTITREVVETAREALVIGE
jgi:DNA transposition AAA+ family ATPase